MPGLRLTTSNRLETLMERLARIVRDAPLPPLEKEIILVQSTGMARWISLEMARINTICANTEFPFPKPFVYNLFRRITPLPETPRFSPETMTWQIMKALPLLVEKPVFEPVRNYLVNDPNGLKAYQLSEKIAVVFDQYLIYRPDMVMKWEKNPPEKRGELDGEAWQAELWRAITQTGTGESIRHQASLKSLFIETIDQIAEIPSRISIFGISTLPPYYIEIFKALSRKSDVFMFYLNPCREYWEYAYGEKEILRFSESGLLEEDQYYETGNPLLGSMGVVGREFFSLVLNTIGDTGEDLFIEPERTSLLSAIQSDILNLVNRKETETSTSEEIEESDTSIQIFSCHSPLREIEVLHDTLLALLDEIPDLSFGDIVVMMPDVSLYAPFIQAVFDTAPEEEYQKIPYAIADRSVRNTNRIADAFLAILSIGKNRFKASEILDVLEHEAVYRKWGLTGEDLIRIGGWVKESGISWGIDGAYKKTLGFPPFHENTLSFGFDRMLLGYALPLRENFETFMGILPFGEFEGEAAKVMGIFIEFTESICHHATLLEGRADLKVWAERLDAILSAFFIVDETTEEDIMAIQEILSTQGLKGYQMLSGFEGDISLDVVLSVLKKKLTKSGGGSGYIRSGVTFCTLLPMRSIPFKVVYILGMNDGDYPRQFENPGFNLMAQKKRLCDSGKRHEDRYLFLESLLSARERFIISYIGQSMKDNSDLPPSVLVSELIDYIESGFETKTGRPIRESLVIKHRLHPFHAAYFNGAGKLFSYSSDNLKAAMIHHEKKRHKRIFFDRPLPFPPADIVSPISLDRFSSFFKSPSRFLLENRLHLRLETAEILKPSDREPFELNALQAYMIRDTLLRESLVHPEKVASYSGIRGTGVLPHGPFGEMEYRQMEQEVLEFSRRIVPYIEEGAIETVETVIDLPLSGISLKGALFSCYTSGQIFFRIAPLKVWDRLNAFIHHLFLNITAPDTRCRDTLVFGKEEAIVFQKLEKKTALDLLETLSLLFVSGLSSPLFFVLNTSFAFSEAILIKGKSEPEALSAAYRKWFSRDFQAGEWDNDYNRLCYPEHLPEEKIFRETALRVFSPLFDHMNSMEMEETK